MTKIELIEPDWPAPAAVHAFSTTRAGGVSTGVLAGLNLGENNGDTAASVAENRRRLRSHLPADPCWLRQVHGRGVIHLDDWREDIEADAAWTDRRRQVAVIRTADCLPVLIADRHARAVAAVHAGWRGLAAGVIEATLAALPVPGRDLLAWIGPSICARCYQVGDEVRAALADAGSESSRHFRPDGRRWRADLKAVAADRLGRAGVVVSDCRRCTHCEPESFFSFRRDGTTGNLATLVWLE